MTQFSQADSSQADSSQADSVYGDGELPADADFSAPARKVAGPTPLPAEQSGAEATTTTTTTESKKRRNND